MKNGRERRKRGCLQIVGKKRDVRSEHESSEKQEMEYKEKMIELMQESVVSKKDEEVVNKKR